MGRRLSPEEGINRDQFLSRSLVMPRETVQWFYAQAVASGTLRVVEGRFEVVDPGGLYGVWLGWMALLVWGENSSGDLTADVIRGQLADAMGGVMPMNG